MARIAIIGPGAIGGVMASWLGRTGVHDVIVCARRSLGTLTLETPTETIVSTPTVVTVSEEASAVDWVLVATKAYDADAAAAWFPKLRNNGTRFAILQNGVEHRERFAPYVAAEKILPVLIYCPAERVEPNLIRQRRAARLVVEVSRAGCDFASLFAGTKVEVETTGDFTTELWRKLCVNAPGVLCALLMQPNGIFRDEGVAEVAREIIRECIAVARAEGALLDESVVEPSLDVFRKGPPDVMNSMHADRVAGRRMEIDARNGAIVRLGRKHGIPTPSNQMAVMLLEKLGGPQLGA
ncbi:MAG: 2-dehydropantoate 2-reductase [Opitutaceae bacterium]